MDQIKKPIMDNLIKLISENAFYHLNLTNKTTNNKVIKQIFSELCDDSSITQLMAKAISNNNNLKNLKLGGFIDKTNVVSIHDAMLSCHFLERLDLAKSSYHFKVITYNLANIISSNIYLKEITLSNIYSYNEMLEIVKTISKSCYFENISLSDCCMDQKFVPWIVNIIKSNTNLKIRNINRISHDESLLDIGLELASNETIQKLVLGRCESTLNTCHQFLDIIQKNYTLTDVFIDPINPDYQNNFEFDDITDIIILTNPYVQYFYDSVNEFANRNKRIIKNLRFLSTKPIYTC